jgi:signal transduction histidine kinase
VTDSIPPQSAEKGALTRIQQLISQVIEDGRRSLRGLRTGTTMHSGLEQAFLDELQNLANPEQITCRVVVQGATLQLRPVIRDEVLSIGREALLNVFRHAAAELVEIEIRYSPGEFQLIVRDDGRGMDHHILLNGRDGHWGLPGMRSHADAIGGKLKILSSPGAGTEVSLRIPGARAYETTPGRRMAAVSHAMRFFGLKPGNRQRERTR